MRWFLLALLFLAPLPARALDCPLLDDAARSHKATDVLEVTVNAVAGERGDPWMYRVEATITASRKGQKSGKVVLMLTGWSIKPEAGKRYLVFARRAKDRLYVDDCVGEVRPLP